MPVALWLTTASQHRFVREAIPVAVMSLVGLLVTHKLLQDGFPPGVDTPTFLHMSWFTRETLHGAGGLTDPYWYGGFPIFQAYPPLSYALVGALAALPGTGLVFVYKAVLLVAFVGTGVATYILARELGNTPRWSMLAGILTMLAYPLMTAVGQWGWFSTIVAMPLSLLALAFLERAYHGGRVRVAILGGLLLGLSVLTHHMTAFAFALGLPTWAVFYYVREPAIRRHLYKMSLIFVGATAASTVWWIVPWAVHILDVGFQREFPGLWTFPLTQYLEAITQRDLIGLYAYPTYLGFGLIVMAIGGTVQALISPSRYTPYGILLLVLVAFSLGEQVNPLIRVEPLNGLDVARFHTYLVPVITIVGLPFLASVSTLLAQGIRLLKPPGWLPTAGGTLVVVLILSQAVWDGATASRRLFEPYRVTPAAQQAFDWFAREGSQGKVLGVGFWNWDDFLLPYYLERAVVDGWHDEGASNWRTVRRLRIMMWTRDVDVPVAHQLLGELNGRYIAVQDYFVGESPDVFRTVLRERTDLFSEVADWGEVTIFERVDR